MHPQPRSRVFKNWLALAILVAYTVNLVLFLNSGAELEQISPQVVGVFFGIVAALGAVGYLGLSLIWMLTGRPGVGLLVVGLLTVVGVAGVTAGVWNFAVDLRSVSYQETRGTIVSSETVTEVTTDYRREGTDSLSQRRTSRRTGLSRLFYVEYRYEVAGQQYRGTKYTTAEHSVTLEESAHLEALYTPGQEVTVYYDPFDSRTAVLKKGLSDRSGPAIYVPLGIGLFLLLCAWLGWLLPGVGTPKKVNV